MCDWMMVTGQCQRPAMEGSRFCEVHEPDSEMLRLNQYIISKRYLGDAPQRHNEHSDVKSVRSEIALLRSLIERKLNMIDSDAEMANALPGLKDAFLAVEKLVSSCHTMETKLGQLLNKQALIQLAQKIVHIIDGNIPDTIENREEIVERIGNDIAEAVIEQTND